MAEDTRPLAGLHPDREVRRRLHMLFAGQFLPRLVFQDPRGFFAPMLLAGADPTEMIREHWLAMETAEGAGPTDRHAATGRPKRVGDLHAELQILAGRPSLLVTMPTPEQPPQTFFISVVLLAPAGEPRHWPADCRARYFTLDRLHHAGRQAMTIGVMSEWTAPGVQGGWHLAVPVLANGFQAAVAQALAGEEAPFGRYAPEPPREPTGRAGPPDPSAAAPPEQPPGGEKPWWKFW